MVGIKKICMSRVATHALLRGKLKLPLKKFNPRYNPAIGACMCRVHNRVHILLNSHYLKFERPSIITILPLVRNPSYCLPGNEGMRTVVNN